jgi:hypothetical protein
LPTPRRRQHGPQVVFKVVGQRRGCDAGRPGLSFGGRRARHAGAAVARRRQAHPAGGAVSGRVRFGRAGAHAGDEGHAADRRPGDRGQQAWRGHHDRRAGSGARQSRRLHPALHHRRHAHPEPASLQETAVRPGQGLHARPAGGALGDGAGRQQGRALLDDGRNDRLRPGESRQAELRLVQPGLHRISMARS